MKFRGGSRREFLGAPARALAGSLMVAEVNAAGRPLSSADQALIEDLSHKCSSYFWEQSDPQSGIARDRARADGGEHLPESRYAGSTGATGFALTALLYWR